jgi:hypothetical protein
MEEHGVVPDVIDTPPTDEVEVSRDAPFLLFAANFIFGISEIILWSSGL